MKERFLLYFAGEKPGEGPEIVSALKEGAEAEPTAEVAMDHVEANAEDFPFDEQRGECGRTPEERPTRPGESH